MAVFQLFDTFTTGSSNSRCESSLALRHNRTTRLSFGQFVLGLLLAVFWSERAFASCGDYLHTRTSSPAVSTSDDVAEMTPGEQGEQRIPCSGPECRSVPQSPAIPPLVPGGVVRTSELAMVDFGILIESSSPQNAFVRISSARVARGFPAQIDVPPECA